MAEVNDFAKEFEVHAEDKAGKKPKTTVRVTLPAGDGLKLFNMAEVSSPAGVTFTVKLAFPMSEAGLTKIADAIQNIGGKFEVKNS